MKETADLLNDRRRPGAVVAEVGFRFTAFDHIKRVEREFVVAEACNSRKGKWYCVEHRATTLFYQRDKDIHVEHRGLRHCLLTWLCDEHGGRPEAVKVARRPAEQRTFTEVAR